MPAASLPLYTCTVTWPGSLAVPLNVGLFLFDRAAGASIVTVGGFVKTSKVSALLDPGPLPMSLGSVACTV